MDVIGLTQGRRFQDQARRLATAKVWKALPDEEVGSGDRAESCDQRQPGLARLRTGPFIVGNEAVPEAEWWGQRGATRASRRMAAQQ